MADSNRSATPFEPIGFIRSCYTDSFGIPRQPRLVTAGEAHLILYPEYTREEAFNALDGFSHIWVLALFHDCIGQGWHPTVRPPRLGGRKRVGVFASRSPFRPNPIALSAVELSGIDRVNGRVSLRLRGIDLMDGTPVLDIKPYVPYSDAIPNARGGFTDQQTNANLSVSFTAMAEAQIERADPLGQLQLRALIEQVIGQDPRPGYMDRYPERDRFALRLYDYDVYWSQAERRAEVTAVLPIEK